MVNVRTDYEALSSAKAVVNSNDVAWLQIWRCVGSLERNREEERTNVDRVIDGRHGEV